MSVEIYEENSNATQTLTKLDEFDFTSIPSDLGGKLKKFKKALDYLVKVKKPAKIVEDQKCYEALFYLKTILSDDEEFLEQNEHWNFLSKSSYDSVIVKTLFHLSKICNKFDISKVNIAMNILKPNLDANERKISIMDYVIIIINKFADIQLKSDYLYEFNKRLFDNKVVEALLTFFKNEKYLNKYSETYDPHDKIVGIIATIRNISENPFFDRQAWKSFKTEEILKEFNPKCAFPDVYKPILDEIITNINQKSLDEFLIYLNEFEDAKTVFNNETIYKDFIFIRYYVKNPIFKKYDEFSRRNCDLIFEKMLNHFYEISDEVDFDTVELEIPIQRINKPEGLNQRRFTIFYNLLTIINEIIFRSIELNVYLGKIEIVKALSAFLNEDFIKRLWNQKCIILLIIKNLSILSRWADDNKKEWNDLNLVEVFLDIIKLFKDNIEKESEEIIISSYYTIGNIADDKQIEALDGIGLIVNKLLDELVLIAEYFEQDKFIQKVKMQFINGGKTIDYLKVSFKSVTGTLYCLTRFAVNEKTKKIIFHKYKALKTIIFKGYTIEKTCALRLLSQLCFNQDIARFVAEDVEMFEFLEEIYQNHKNKDLKKITQIIIWTLNQQKMKKLEPKTVFISHNSSTRDLCLKIRDELEKNGFTVFMNTNAPNGSHIEESACGVEKSHCVLICVCEKYRLSGKCQAEAQHSLRLKKQIIPLIMQEGYENIDSGWLVPLVKNLQHINFVNKNGFDESMKSLVKEINEPSLVLIKNVEEWQDRHVSKWFLENEIHPLISETFENCDGFTLKQIYGIRCETPEFFHQSLMRETNNSIKNTDIDHFGSKLEELFKN